MKNITATKFRILLSVAIALVASLMITVFVLGYQHLQGVGEETAKHQADAAASEDSVAGLQRLQAELETKKDIAAKLSTLRSSNSLPQFDTERSLRTIASQLGLPITGVTFVNTESGDGAAQDAAQPPSSATEGSATQNAGATNTVWGKNSTITFELGRNLSYEELLRFLDAIETSSPKLRISGISLPDGSSRSSIDVGSLTLELATL